MATTPQEFKDLAVELIGASGEFAAFRKPCVITTAGAFDYGTQAAAQTVQTVQMVELSQMAEPLDSKAVPVFDIGLIGVYSEFARVPAIENTRFTFGGRSFTLLKVDVDPAQATITLGGNV